MEQMRLQKQYDLIHAYFKVTTEPFDCLAWDGQELIVYLEGVEIEKYSLGDLQTMIKDF